jgi:hypothetical protein
MSDELFEKLDRIENKSLFIRKLVERELEILEDRPDTSNNPWVQDFTILKDTVEDLSLKLNIIEKHLAGKISIDPDSESASDILAPGSLISYKDRTLAHITADADEPIIIPLDKDNSVVSDTTIQGTPADVAGFQEREIQLQSSEIISEQAFIEAGIHDVGQKPPVELAFAQPAIQEEHSQFGHTFAEPQIEEMEPEELTESILKVPQQKRDKHAYSTAPAPEVPLIIPEPRQAAMPASEASIIPDIKSEVTRANDPFPTMLELTQQVTPASEPTPVMPEFNQQVIPAKEPGPIMPAFNQNVIPISEQKTTMPVFDQNVIPVNDPTPVIPAFNQHVTPVSQHKPTMPIFDQNTTPVSEPASAIPDFNQQVTPVSEPKQTMPIFDQNATPVSEPAPPMPVFEQQAEPISEPSFIMQEFKSQAMAEQETKMVMPEFKMPDDAEQMTTAIPVFGDQNQTENPDDLKQPIFKLHEIPEPLKTEKMPPFIAPSIPDTQETAHPPPFIEPQSAPMPQLQPTQPAQSNSKPGKLEGNILMYMPRGAKVKKEIIKSLISKQFSEGEIEAKISELVSAGVLRINEDSEDKYLIRS